MGGGILRRKGLSKGRFAAEWRARRLRPAVADWGGRHEELKVPHEIAAHQLAALNECWPGALARSPFARAFKATYGLPERFESWEQFDAIVPVMDKQGLRTVLRQVTVDAVRHADVVWRATGGSTGEPFRFPTFRDEHAAAGLDIWLGRARLGIDPAEPMFLLWGHAHLLGRGLKGAMNKLHRRLSDALLGYTRVSAYDLAEEDLAVACDRLLSDRPSYVVGYSSALDRFARTNARRAGKIGALRLKAVIATAEGFPRADSRERITATFGAPVFMEYGSVETGPLAHERPDGDFDVFHIRHRLSRRGGGDPFADEVLVTSLDVRAMPLMRYALGDLVEADSSHVVQGSILRLSRVVGRCNEIVVLPTGAVVHSEMFTHCVRDVQGIDAFQVVAPPGNWPRLRYTGGEVLPGTAAEEIRRRLAVIAPELAGMAIERVDSLPVSVAGKHRMVVDA